MKTKKQKMTEKEFIAAFESAGFYVEKANKLHNLLDKRGYYNE